MNTDLAIDHLVLVVPDLQIAASNLFDATGLASIDGGRHHHLGTANRIVPLGDAYLELLAVVDAEEARTNPWGRWALEKSQDNEDTIHAVSVRTPSIESTAARLGTELGDIARTTPDGRELRARLTGMAGALGADCLPFFIEWTVPEADQPSRQPAAHRVSIDGELTVEFGGSPKRLRDWLGSDLPTAQPVGGPPGVRSALISTNSGPIRL